MPVDLPPELLDGFDKAAVIRYLIGQPAPGLDKVRVLKRWAKWAGVKLTAAELGRVDASGIQAPQPIELPGEAK